MTGTTWEHVEHDADIGLRAAAGTREELFEAMAEALTAIVTEPSEVRPVESVAVSCEAPDDALLLVDWLNAVIYEMATRGMLFGWFQVSIDGQQLSATLKGEPVDRARHRPVVEVKGATYTSLDVGRDERGLWHAECVVDV